MAKKSLLTDDLIRNIKRKSFIPEDDDSYTNELYLLPAGAAVNANRTILNKNIKLQIYYSEL